MQVPYLTEEIIHDQVARALEEDVGPGDCTADLLAEQGAASARVIARESAVICGSAWFEEVFRQLDGGARFDWRVADGGEVLPTQPICEVTADLAALLTGERTALNFLQALSGTATLARRYAAAVAGTGVRILDTRKTVPGLRLAQKYAVLCGGCHNHRIGLFDAILIKENHILGAGSITRAVVQARQAHPELSIEVEVESIDELEMALEAEADRVLLDNFDLERLAQAVALTSGRARLEASGGVTLKNVRSIAETGVDDISVGALTKDIKAIDLSLRIV